MLNKIKVNPNDAASQKYLKAFISNLAFEGVAGGIFGAAKYGISRDAVQKFVAQPTKEFAKNVTKGVSKTADYVLPTAVKGLGKKIKRIVSEELTSRMGLTDRAFKSLLQKEGRARDLVTYVMQSFHQQDLLVKTLHYVCYVNKVRLRLQMF